MAKHDNLNQVPYVLLDRRRYHKDLSVVRESYRQVNEQLFEVCCRMQRHFDPKDLEQASVLAEELKTLKECEKKLERLEHAVSVGGATTEVSWTWREA